MAGSVDQAPQPLGEQLPVAVRREVEDQAAGDGGQRHHEEHPRHHGPRQVERLFGPASPAATPRAARAARKAPAQASAMAAGTTKAARQPAYLTRKPVSTAAKAMPRLPASPFSPMVKPGFVELLDDHRDADGMVDRRERAHQGQRRGERPHARGESDQEAGRRPMPMKNTIIIARRPHRSPSRPAGSEPSPNSDEGADGVGHEVLPRHAPLGGDRGDRGGEDQEEEVVQRMTDVQQQRGGTRVHGLQPTMVGCRRRPSWRSLV